MRKRRPFGRRMNRRRTNSSYSTQRGNVNTMGYSNNRLSRTAYKNRLWRDSLMANHYRSFITFVNATITSPANGTLMNIQLYPLIPSNFWLASGGFVGGLTTFSGGDLYIRGGLTTYRFNNDGAADANITMWTLRMTLNPVLPVAGTTDTMWDPTQIQDFEKSFRIVGRKEFALASNETQTLKRKLRTQKIDQDIWNIGGSREYYVIGITAPSGVAANVSLTAGHSMSFTGDVV